MQGEDEKLYPLKNIKVLVVDDDIHMNKLVKGVLNVFGFHSITVLQDAEEALKQFKANDFHFIISDWQMKGMDGIDMVKNIRSDKDPNKKSIPILMLTGKAAKEDIEHARDAGITEFLVKPFSVASLKKRIIEIIENPRSFIISRTYTGPDRRRLAKGPPKGVEDRRKRQE